MKVFQNKWRTNSIPDWETHNVFCGYKVSYVIGQNTMNIPEIFSVFTVLLVWVYKDRLQDPILQELDRILSELTLLGHQDHILLRSCLGFLITVKAPTGRHRQKAKNMSATGSEAGCLEESFS